MDNWKDTMDCSVREQYALNIFCALHPNCWAAPDLFPQAIFMEKATFVSSTCYSQYLLRINGLIGYLNSQRGRHYEHHINSFGAFVMNDFDRRRYAVDNGVWVQPLLPHPVTCLPVGSSLPTYNLPLAPPLYSLFNPTPGVRVRLNPEMMGMYCTPGLYGVYRLLNTL